MEEQALKRELYQKVLKTLDINEEISDEDLLKKIDAVLEREGKSRDLPIFLRLRFRKAIFASLRLLDVLSLAMDDEEITEIMVNGASRIFVEKNGSVFPYGDEFMSEEKLSDVVQQIASAVNRRVNEASPMADARLKDGSRVNIVLPPIAVDGPAVTIRRFPKETVSMGKLCAYGSLTEEAAAFLEVLVKSGYNIFISGGTGAGKTTFLGALSEYIPEQERVITIEDSAELRLRNVKNLVRLESRPPNLEGEYEVTIRDLIRNALRMRPDRIIVGEVRGAETVDLLQALNTGHSGSMSTGHANSAWDMISRLEMMVLMGMDIPMQAVRQQIASGLDILVHLSRLRDKSRRVMGIYELTGIEGNEIRLVPLFEFKEEGEKDGKVIGRLVKSEYQLSRKEKLLRYGLQDI